MAASGYRSPAHHGALHPAGSGPAVAVGAPHAPTGPAITLRQTAAQVGTAGISAVWTQIRTADVAAQATIRSLERRVNGVRSAGSGSELITLSAGLPADWQPRANDSLAVNRARLLGRIEPELAKLRTNVDQRKNQAIQVGLKEGSKNALLALIYAWAMASIRHRISATDVFDESIEEPFEENFEEPFEEHPDGSFEDSFAEPHDDSDLENPELSDNA